MSDRALWLEEWCPTCRVAPGSRCRTPYYEQDEVTDAGSTSRAGGGPGRARHARPRRASRAARRPGARPRVRTRHGCDPGGASCSAAKPVWRELEARGATIATVPFSGRAGRGGRIDRIVLSRLDGDELVDVERWTSRDELCHALEAPVWDRFGSFAGQPPIAGTVAWTSRGPARRDRGPTRRSARFEELV